MICLDDSVLTKKLAFMSIFYGALIALGSSLVAVGASLYFSILPLLRDYIVKGGTDKDFQFIGALGNSSIYFLGTGLAIIVLSVLGAYLNIFRPKKTFSR